MWMVITYRGRKASVMFNGEVETCFSVAKNSDLNKSDILTPDHTEVIPLTTW